MFLNTQDSNRMLAIISRDASASSRIDDRLESSRKVYVRLASERASDSASRGRREFRTKHKPYIETQIQWPRQVGRGAVLAARARVRETATLVSVCAARRADAERSVSVRVWPRSHTAARGQVYLQYYINWVLSSLHHTLYRLFHKKHIRHFWGVRFSTLWNKRGTH